MWLLWGLLFLCGAARADVGLMLNESLRVGASRWTGAGHASVYLSNICAKSPIELRPCEPGEDGVVLTNYRDFGEDKLYEWNAIPLSIYLYGVEDESERSFYATPTVRWIMQERYREKYLNGICRGACATNPAALWRDSVAATYLRDIYMFRVKTTPEQDHALLERLQRGGNVGHYNGFTNNCADFVREVVNEYFPGAAKADHVNDFWMTSPKAIAKSFTHYALKHPELEFRVVRYSQIPGEYDPSRDNRKGSEQLYRSNRWRVPLAILLPEELLAFTGSYLATGRFNPELELRNHPSEEIIALQTKLQLASSRGDRPAVKECKQKIRAARSEALGTDEEWAGYAHTVRQYKEEVVRSGYVSDAQSFKAIPHNILAQKWITLDERGGLWLTPRSGNAPRVGLSARTMSASRQETTTAYLLALSRVDAELHRKPKNRETLEFFRKDWALMEHLRGQQLQEIAGTRRSEQGGGAAQ